VKLLIKSKGPVNDNVDYLGHLGFKYNYVNRFSSKWDIKKLKAC